MLKNREEAGRQIANLLDKYTNKNPLILACTRDSVETAGYVAGKLNAELSILVATRLSYPGQDNYFFGALCEGDKLYVDGARHLLTDSLIRKIVDKEKKRIDESIHLYRNGRGLPLMEGRTVILLNDMIIHGFEFVPAIRLCRERKAAKIVVAAAVGNIVFDTHVAEADEISIAHQHTDLKDISEIYETYGPLTNREIRTILKCE
jgi:putative phosphoribosyl transferase